MIFVWTLVSVALVLAVTFAVARRQGRHTVVDVAWGLGFAVVAVVGHAVSEGYGYDGDPGRRLLVTALTVLWGVRLAVHIGLRSRGRGEDPRYAALLEKAPGSRDAYALRKVYLTQGPVLWFVSLPVQVAMLEKGTLGVAAYAGTALWLVGPVPDRLRPVDRTPDRALADRDDVLPGEGHRKAAPGEGDAQDPAGLSGVRGADQRLLPAPSTRRGLAPPGAARLRISSGPW